MSTRMPLLMPSQPLDLSDEPKYILVLEIGEPRRVRDLSQPVSHGAIRRMR